MYDFHIYIECHVPSHRLRINIGRFAYFRTCAGWSSLSQIERVTPTELRELGMTKLLILEEKTQFGQRQNSIRCVAFVDWLSQKANCEKWYKHPINSKNDYSSLLFKAFLWLLLHLAVQILEFINSTSDTLNRFSIPLPNIFLRVHAQFSNISLII